MIKYNKLLAKYKKFWDKFSNDIKTKFDNELAYNEKHPKKKNQVKSTKIFMMMAFQKNIPDVFVYQLY